jgi:DNA-binding CsgD family transcriptional regulator
MAFAYLGLRLFSLCDKALQRVEQYAATTNDLHHILNTRCLRARLCLCTGQLERAASEVAYEPPATPTDGMLQEFLATRALVNVSCATDETSFSVRDREPTTVEAATLLAMARAIHAARRNDGETVFNEVALCNSLDTWDAFVCSVRAEPRLLRIVARDQPWRSRVESILARSRDVALARTVGIQLKLPVSKHAALLSPREGEVFELLREGLTNREIARALFISEATAKVHVRHVMEKLNAKTRTEAANRILASPEG